MQNAECGMQNNSRTDEWEMQNAETKIKNAKLRMKKAELETARTA
jgi:hypothetical protein